MRRTAFFVLAASFSLSAVGIAFSGDLSQRYAPPAYSILAWMEVVMYSLLALALMKIFAAGGSQHFGDGLDGSSPRV